MCIFQLYCWAVVWLLALNHFTWQTATCHACLPVRTKGKLTTYKQKQRVWSMHWWWCGTGINQSKVLSSIMFVNKKRKITTMLKRRETGGLPAWSSWCFTWCPSLPSVQNPSQTIQQISLNRLGDQQRPEKLWIKPGKSEVVDTIIIVQCEGKKVLIQQWQAAAASNILLV